MKANICFVPESFDFSNEQDLVALSIKASSELVEKYFEGDGFISFSKSNDFDARAAGELFKQPAHLDAGTIMGLLYDANMGRANNIAELDSAEVIALVDTAIPEHDGAWVALYSSDSSNSLTIQAHRNVVDARSLVEFCSYVLVQNPRTHGEYAESFVQLYKNLIFLDYPDHSDNKTFDSLRKTEGGYQSFIEGITDCLNFMDQYEIIPHDSQKNIGNLNAGLPFPVTAEGTGKNRRSIAALKRDFLIDSVEYKNVNCEYHYKLERVDGANGKGAYYYNRIYFGFFNRINPEKPQIAVAHIGEHL
ncbi:hypothetical protein ACSHDS_002799 [Vibrio alginolyticus]|uniref:hypothetical protein n=1 Tax=Vibrio parahaemolyticus TaxID=670 RepID=UPI00111D807A|nr:hypothetical protein [Vibrio parahaemolyticus]EHV9720172.1 hypothetical protein [Vibrio parahaemolyticus]EID7698072.1 hypothetical protein [Vibrio parahaemolyticus]EIU6781259.1 hypothetical protein [Vibrio parahaemolyticus]EJG1426093.1 hypothetical protein [Vibrio parahaemolyticus]MBE4455695.1 hypothetical protein [Vibrio parahaemolyticus]